MSPRYDLETSRFNTAADSEFATLMTWDKSKEIRRCLSKSVLSLASYCRPSGFGHYSLANSNGVCASPLDLW